MRTKIVYVADDDTEFNTAEECERHNFSQNLKENSGLYLQTYERDKLTPWLFENYNMTPKIPEVTLENLP